MLNRIGYLLFAIFALWHTNIMAQDVYSDSLAHTFSIVARDTATGEMGVAVQTHAFAVGTRVPWAEAGVGAIATQSFTNVSFGPRGLGLLKEGMSAEAVLQQLIDSDDGRDVRQVGIIDSRGNTAAWTGEKCIREAGHLTGDNFAVQANMMLTAEVWPAMAEAFRTTTGPLAQRLLAALEAAQDAGGDIRGQQSAALLVVEAESNGKPWQGRKIDLRVDDHARPIAELKRLLDVYYAYQHMSAGEQALEHNDLQAAAREYRQARQLAPNNLGMRYWRAVSLANLGMVQEALPLFKQVFAQDPNWRTLTERLPEVDLLKVTQDDLLKIVSQQ